jgi:hypothetical protein
MSARALLAAGSLSLLAAGAVVALPAGASPGGGGCQLHGNVKFVNGPNTTAHAFSYTFLGALSNCQSSQGAVPATGSIVTLIPGKGSGTCTSGSTAGVAYVKWADGTATIVKYTTTDAGAEVLLQGNVIPSYKVGKKTYKTTRYAGAGAVSDLAFEADPTQCAGSGVTSAPMDGFAGLGYTT